MSLSTLMRPVLAHARRLAAARWLTLCTAALLAGCAGVQVSSLPPSDYLSQRRSDILTAGTLSAATQETLRVIGLERKRCEELPVQCRDNIVSTPGLNDDQRLSALAELWTQAALQAQRAAPNSHGSDEIDAWLEAARHAYAYLFFSSRKPGERMFEDRQTQVRDYYNHAVEQAITGMFHHSQQRHLAALDASVLPWNGWTLHTSLGGIWLPRDAQMPRELIPASSLTFSGLRNIYRRDGFGAELVAVFPTDEPSGAPDEPLDTLPTLSSDQPFQEAPYPALTALLRFEGATLAEVLQTRVVHVQMYDPYRFNKVLLAGEQVPLAANFTSGYGLWLARSGFSVQALRSLLGLDNGLLRPQIYLMQPYDPGRRVVLMLHGLASSPEAWINVANEVLGDETLRQNYQIWQVYYPTNAPLALNNRAIRDALQATFAHFDPQGLSAASQHTTVIGHSMGGVLARLLVSSTGAQIWDRLLEDYQLQPGQQAALQRRMAPLLNFEPLPSITDAIFIAAPHRGTAFANHRIARWAANLITLPFSMLEQVGDVTRALAQLKPRPGKQGLLRIPNSIDNLSDEDPFVRLASNLPLAPQLRYHSIIGDAEPGLPLADSSDGIVPYASAHLPGAASELVIASGHSVQEHPQAIIEIRRILHEQLQRTQPAGARP
ncbi:triacylglycerol lipase [Pantoea sp. 18069]|uniref:esterase/lipase family protein n=1 Tax=Pantoea sp. 18069 TaxID=2681415 RepID=UPI001F3E74B6|nr:alpha/beta hydrolase [Pantoea sp. 18069]